MAMMTDTLKAAAKAVLAPLERIRDAEASLANQQLNLHARLIELRQFAAQAALPKELGGDEGPYANLLKDISAVETSIIKNAAAIRQTQRMKAEAEAARVAQRHEDDVLEAQRLAKERQEICQQLANHIAGAVEAWKQLYLKGVEIVGWRGELAISHGGLLLTRDDLNELVRAEMARLSVPDELDVKAPPRFPGTDWKVNEGNPRNNKELVNVAQAANAFLVERIKNAPVAAKVTPAKSTIPPAGPETIATAEEMAALEAPQGPKVSAADAIAQLGGSRRLSI